jgi:hypothetical protein
VRHRCRWPPDNSAGRLCSSPLSRTRSTSSPTRRRRSSSLTRRILRP